MPNYPGFLLLGVALWNFFSEGTTNGASALLARADLLTKTVVPRQIMVYSALLSAGLTFVINLVVLMVMLPLTGTPLGDRRRSASRCCSPISSLLTLGIVAAAGAALRALPRRRLPVGHRACRSASG